MSLKDIFQQDIEDIFLNEDEFAEKHNIDSVLYTCILIDEKEIQSGGEKIGVYVKKTTLLINESLIQNPPIEGQRLKIDGYYKYVEGVTNEKGLLNITLTENKST